MAAIDVSLILCTRNRAAQLERALSQLLQLNLEGIALELVVVDNGSSDATPTTLASFAARAPFPMQICLEPRAGLGRARNRGLAAASADLLVFSDDDCYFDPDYFQFLASLYDPSLYGFGGGQILLANPEDDPRVAHLQLQERVVIPAGSYFIKAGIIQGANIFFHRQVFARVGVFRPDMGAGTPFPCEDIEMACRASQGGFAGLLLPELKVFHDHGRRLNSPQAKASIASYAQGRGAYFASLFCAGKVDALLHWAQRYTGLPQLKRRHLRMLARELRAGADLIDSQRFPRNLSLTVQRDPWLQPELPSPATVPPSGPEPGSPSPAASASISAPSSGCAMTAPPVAAASPAPARILEHPITADRAGSPAPVAPAKIFGIGLNKTGTTTLGTCLQILGFRHCSFDLALLEQAVCGDLEPLFQTVSGFDSFEDWPYPLLYEQLDQRFPGSRFVLSRRASPERWLESLCAHALRTDPLIGSRCRSLAYGLPFPQLDPGLYLEHYHRHLEGVRAYFRDRPSDLLEVCWEEAPRWEPLCAFLDRPVPSVPFPHANAAHPPDPDHLRRNTALIAWHRRLRGASLV